MWQDSRSSKAVLAGGRLSKWDRAGKICEVEPKAANASSCLVVHRFKKLSYIHFLRLPILGVCVLVPCRKV